MPTQDQLEIIGPSGEIEFHNLDPARGITNIGRHPENDVVIDGPNVAPFHAVLDHRQRPYHIMLLSEEGETTLGGQRLPPNVSTGLHNWDAVEIDGYTMILLEGTLVPAAVAAVKLTPSEVIPLPDEEVAVPTPETPPAPALVQRPVSLVTLPPDETDDFILTELPDREWMVNVDQTVSCPLAITNGGHIVAAFEVRVEGVDESWVTIIPSEVNLYEGERATVTVSITPPRLPTSRAGVHPLAVVVTSSNYPDRVSRLGVTLLINPYYEFTVGDLSPKQQTVSWRKRSGQVVIPIINKGNSETPFRLEGEDDERACRFEFQAPGEEVSLVRQTELRLSPGETLAAPVRITPLSRRLVALRKRRYSFTVTTTLLEGAQTPRSVMGQLKSAPLIGPWLVALMALLIAALIVAIFRPKITLFTVDPQTVKAGESVTLYWNVSQFAKPRIDQDIGVVEGPVGQATAVPVEDVTYRLEANNWLSRLSSRWFGAAEEVYVDVVPVKPEIRVFSVDRDNILRGETVTLSWEVNNADEVILETNGKPETLLSTDHTAQRTVQLNIDTDYVLRARNRDGEDLKNLSVFVTVPLPTPTPTATPLPTPFIQIFSVQPPEITEGESITIDWLVIGVDSVSIAPIPDALPSSGTASRSPDTTTQYILTASNGQQEVRSYKEVIVKPAPTSTPEPKVPVIEFFQLTDDEVVLGDDDEVTLTWSVTGETTNVQISGPDFGSVSGLPPKGNMPFTPEEAKATLFVLTAFNGDLSASATAQLKVEEPTPTPLPATPTPTPTATPVPPNIVFFQVSAADAADDEKVDLVTGSSPPTYEVVAGTKVNLDWLVQDAIKVTLTVDGESLGNQDFKGPLPRTIRSDGNYLLTAENAQAETTNASLRIEVTQETPLAPFNISGEVITDTIEIEWEYYTQFENDIIGFRLYRADAPPGTNFKRVADEKVLLPGSRDWVDTKDLDQTCGKAYYLVAVYIDFENNLLETNASETSWYSLPCSGP